MTSPPVTQATTLEEVFKGSWTLLRRNWVLVLPMIFLTVAIVVLVGILVVVAIAGGMFAATSPRSGAIAALVVAYLAFFVVVIVMALWATAATYGMADAAWERGIARLADGFAAAAARWRALLVAGVGFLAAGIAALILFIPTLGLVFLALPVVTMYVVPAVVSGGAGGFEAFAESWRLVRRYLGSSVIAILILMALQYVVTIVAYIGIVPIEIGLGAASASPNPAAALNVVVPLLVVLAIFMMVAIVFAYAYAAYHALVVVGIYRWLRARAVAEDAAAAAVAAAPAPQIVLPAEGPQAP